MKTKKEDVIQFLASSDTTGAEQFNQAFELFRNSENKNSTQERHLNKTGYSESTLSTVLYELQKIHGISENDIRKAKKTAVMSIVTEDEDLNLGVNQIDVNGLLIVSVETLEATKTKVIEVFANAPDEVKQEIKFRDEFPFISDTDLPAELKQLVTEKFNHYYAFADAHTALSNGLYADGDNLVTLSNDEIFELAKTAVSNFQMDQLIREEFVYYNENKKVLGVHPIFKERKLQDTVNSMTTAELAKRVPLLENYIRRDKGKSDNAKEEADKIKYAEKVKDWEFELALVNVKLGNSASK